ncbi:MAG TPA: EAL domain-containing protein [Candidatus Omnitrophota bacterium]|nr:EAL domain-containing protein [Candidatus Omnitrophota bacterium]HPD84735.1 EAL domain-containing protein [Candidatus Omnitrophota bacterium]HRZ03593.1 EAL domain-containing protein [Candidatus Omnitrophota bacterium]
MNKKHILIVDDEADFSQVVADLLEQNHYKADIAHTGAQALEKAKHNPDLILLDRKLPDMDGFEICRKIRDNKRLRGTPIIIISARGESIDKIEGLYVGADDYITKPFHIDELFARIDAVLRRSRFSKSVEEDKPELIAELNRIIKNDLITPFFQPIFLTRSFEPLGVEVLSRPPIDSPLSNPELLFKAALAYGTYYELEMLVWRKAIFKWKNSAKKGKIFLNCSPYLVEDDRFDDTIIQKFEISPSDVVLEITERSAVKDYAMFLGKLAGLKRLGLGVAVDDVGSGFASLDTIAELKPDFVKIDIMLVRDIHMDYLKQNIAEAVIFFCKKSGIFTIAEGIEKVEELLKVTGLGVDALQGYFLARPAPEIDLACKAAV